jgi:type I restriction enzyme, S subunit
MSSLEGWVTKRFDEIGTIVSGSTPSTTMSSFWKGEIVWVTPNDLSRLNSPYLRDSAKRITQKGLSGCSAHLLPAGSVVMSSRAPIGYVAIPTVEFCTNQGCKSIQLKDGFTSEFTYYNILFNIDKVKNLGEGTTFAEISKTALSKVEIDFPVSRPEQTKIAEILLTVDRAIEQTEALIAKQQRIKTGLMQDLLTRGIDEHGNLRSEQTHKFKDSPLGRIPVEWEVLTLREVVAITRLAGYEYSTYWTPLENGEIITLRGYNIGKNKIIERSFERISERLSQRLIRSRLFIGDVVFPCVGTIGNAVLIQENNKYHINQNIAKITPSARIDGSYLVHYLMSQLCRIEIDRFNASSSQPNVLVGSLRQFRIPTPPSVQEQKCISEKLSCQDESEEQEIKNLVKLRSLKAALMQDLLTAKKRVTALLNETERVH